MSNKKTNCIKFVAVLLLAVLLISTLASCNNDNPQSGEVTKLSFKAASGYDYLKSIAGSTVTISGYIATSSPVDGSFIFLMNLPYQSCPFCVPNTTQLSNTLAVYSKDGKAFEFTDLLIRIEGELEFGDFTDEYGYQYSYRIKDAAYKKVDTSELGEKYMLWQQLAQTGVVADVYAMHEYIYFLCFWSQYTAEFPDIGRDYLYPENALDFIKIDGMQYNYGYVDGYFDDMVRRIEEVDPEAFATLVKNIRNSEELAKEALSQLENGEYMVLVEYSGVFGDGRTQYKMNNNDEFVERTQAIFSEFADWIAEWEV